MVWMVVALMLLLGTFRGSVPLAGTFFFLFLMYMLLGIAHFTGSGTFITLIQCLLDSANWFIILVAALRAGGIIGCISAVLAFYTGAIGLHNRDTTYWDVPAIGLARRDRDVADTRTGQGY